MIIKLTGLETCTSGIEGAAFGHSQDCVPPSEPQIVSENQESESEHQSPSPPKRKKAQKQHSNPTELLEVQIDLQEDFYQNQSNFSKQKLVYLADIAETTKTMAQEMEKFTKIAQENFNLHAKEVEFNEKEQNLQKLHLEIYKREHLKGIKIYFLTLQSFFL